ncbi:MAG: D-aminoacyl-tRNA deacylase [Microgenomates group bacterium]
MRLVIQRVQKTKVVVNKKVVGQTGPGMIVFLGIGEGDGEEEIDRTIKKILNLRIFENNKEKFAQSILEIKGEIMVIPQFTLFADCSKGNRPYFGQAARGEIAKPLFERFVEKLKKSGLKIESGIFGAKMQIEVLNDGPVTIILS